VAAASSALDLELDLEAGPRASPLALMAARPCCACSPRSRLCSRSCLPDFSAWRAVAGADVGEAVRLVLGGPSISGRHDYDLVEDTQHTLADLVKAVRSWVGRNDAPIWSMPGAGLGFAMGRVADLAGALGWRSPLRTTALKSLADGVTGDPEQWRSAGGFQLKPLHATLASLPSTTQERALRPRPACTFQLLLVTLSAFWLLASRAYRPRPTRRRPQTFSRRAWIRSSPSVGWSGREALLTLRSVLACFFEACDTTRGVGGQFLVSFGYLTVGTWLTPELWADPLGPLCQSVAGNGARAGCGSSA